MAFVLSKLLWVLTRPSHLLLLLIVVGTLLLFTRHRRLGRAAITGGILVAFAVAVLPLASWLAAPLENRFAVPHPMPAQIDGIVVLGGAVELSGQEIDLNSAGDRLIGLMALAHRYPDAPIVYSGGSALIAGSEVREADLAKRVLESVGFEPARITFEREARNTHENAVFSRRLVEPEPEEVWLLVTSATHMPRSVGCFRKAGWPVVAYPVDYRVHPERALEHRIDFAGNLVMFEAAMKEWIGLVAYYLLGYTNALFPGPDNAPGRSPTPLVSSL